MKRKSQFRLGVFLLAALLQASVSAAVDFDEGIDYQRIGSSQPTESSSRIEVTEMFWYRCPHCYRFEPVLEKWLESEPEHVRFTRIPAIPRSDWAFLARVYYTEEFLGVVDRIHRPLFDAIHKDKRKLRNQQDVADFFIEHGISQEKFDQAWNSDAVAAKVRQARQVTEQYEISGVPTMIINGKYRTSAILAGGSRNLLKVVEYLIDKEYREMNPEQP